MKRFWISWVQCTRDYRPLTDPPTEPVLGWWCSGYGISAIDMEEIHEGDAILCAVVVVPDASTAKDVIFENWSPDQTDIGKFRFCSEKPDDWTPGDRFPITQDWEKERFKRQVKHDPACDCGICQYCGGDEDIFGNPTRGTERQEDHGGSTQ